MNIEPGIYLDMTDEEYFAQRALGSTDMKALFLDAESWWWEMHPDSPLRPEETPDDLKRRNDARRVGQARRDLAEADGRVGPNGSLLVEL